MTHPASWAGDRPVEVATEDEAEPARGRDAAVFIGSLVGSLLLLTLVAG